MSNIPVVPQKDKKAVDKRVKFVKFVNLRMGQALKRIKLVGNLSNKLQYMYTDADVEIIGNALQNVVDETILRFKGKAFLAEAFDITRREEVKK